jgi:hypothetical protein
MRNDFEMKRMSKRVLFSQKNRGIETRSVSGRHKFKIQVGKVATSRVRVTIVIFGNKIEG